MHERVQQLAEQAGIFRPKEFYQHIDALQLEKFAELLIQQCMACSTWVGKNNTNSVEPLHTAHAINQRIKQQFGVEE